MAITIWHMAGSPPSWAVRMMAEILGLDLDCKEIDFIAMEHKSPEFLKINPMGTVPVIKDGDFTIAESHSILKYLLSKYGKDQQEQWYPSDIKARALVDQAMFFDAGVAFIRIKIIALPTIFNGLPGLTPEIVQQVEDAYSVVETYLGRHRFAAADHLTIADLTLGSTVYALDHMCQVDAAKFPRVKKWLGELEKLPYFKKIAVSGAAGLAQVVSSFWEKNKK